jgi:hypothetical protein
MKKLFVLFSISLFASSATFAQNADYYTGDSSNVTVQAQQPPPALPDYTQPECPGDGYLWEPGYWAWGGTDYYWVPGVWVLPPEPGLLWTPGYWGFYGGFYGWHPGYWGAEVGFYGGINYGFGYYGTGFYGGRWENGHFLYNTAAWRINRNVIHNVYVSKDGIRGASGARVSFNGAHGVRPAAREETIMHSNHRAATPAQISHEQIMSKEKGQFHANAPRPAVHSMSVPGGQRFNERGRPVGGGGGARGRR